MRSGIVLSLWRDSCGCWIIMIWVLVGIGVEGMTWHRHTGCGLLQFGQIDLRFSSAGDSIASTTTSIFNSLLHFHQRCGGTGFISPQSRYAVVSKY